MYGFIYNTLRNLVVEKFGLQAWTDICDEAGTYIIKDGILDRQCYEESYLPNIARVASNKLGVSVENIFEMFGSYFFTTCKKSGHSSILRTLGHNLYGFLLNLDTLHDHLSFTYTQMRAPSFRCEKSPSGLTLYYYSQRPGLSHIVTGIVKAVAKDFYQLDITVDQVSYEETDGKLPHHYVLKIEVEESAKTDNYLERLTGEISAPNIINTLPTVDDDQEMQFDPNDLNLRYPHVMLQHAGGGSGTHHTLNVTGGGVSVLHTLSENDGSSDGGGCTVHDLAVSADGPAGGGASDVVCSVGGGASTAVCPIGGGAGGGAISSMMGEAKMFESSGEEPAPHSNIVLPLETQELIRQQMQLVGNSMPRPFLPALSMSRYQSRRGSMIPGAEEWPVNVNLFQLCFPFHIIFDKDMIIRYMGISLTRLLPKAIISTAKLTDYFGLDRPKVAFTYRNIRTSLHNSFVLYTKSSVMFSTSASIKEALYFRGQMVMTSRQEGAPILFLCSPRVSSVEELENQGLYLSDIPVHDVTRDLLLLNRHFRVEMTIAAELEETKKDLEIQKACVEHEKHRADQLLHTMLPPSVASQLQSRGEARAMDYSSVTILFSDIKGFTTICKSVKPMEVVGLLNSLYTLFDFQSEKYRVYKVETIGDAYMVAAGLLDTPTEHAEAVTNMAFGMMQEAGKVMEPTNKSPLQVRIGIHTGPVVAGVVGRKMPRYCLFGDTVNTASRMESHGEPGKVHISEVTHSKMVGNPRFKFESRGEIYIKGLGDRQTYFVELVDNDDGYDATVPRSLPHEEGVNTADKSILAAEGNQCQLIKMPALTRQREPSPFSEEEKKGGGGVHRPTVVDMVKPQAPLEEAWNRVTPSQSAHTSTDSSCQPGTPRTSRITPSTDIAGNSKGGSQKSNRSLFIGSGPSTVTPEPLPRTGRNKAKCVLC